MARPKKTDARTITYKVRLSEEENRILAETSEYAAAPKSEVFRSALYNYHQSIRKGRKQKAFSLKLRTCAFLAERGSLTSGSELLF